jgi:phosphatidylserine/phosphatidylglycerophosphate/cardiolipin synthase-like enzyme
MAKAAFERGISHSFDALTLGKWPMTVAFIVIAPVIGLILAYMLMIAVYWIFRNSSPSRMDRYFRKLQLVSAALYSFSHAKYVIVDKTQVAIMSMNFNADAMLNERNYGLIDRDPEDIADVQSIFEYDWAIAGGATAQTPANLTCTRLIVSPTNSKQRIVDHIKAATSTLDVEVMYITEATVRTAITDAKARGVTVRVLIEDPTDESVPVFKAAGIPVKQPPSSIYLHSKLIISDAVAFVGSENMSYTSLVKNREVGELVFEPTAFAPIQSQFDSDWNVSTAIP